MRILVVSTVISIAIVIGSYLLSSQLYKTEVDPEIPQVQSEKTGRSGKMTPTETQRHETTRKSLVENFKHENPNEHHATEILKPERHINVQNVRSESDADTLFTHEAVEQTEQGSDQEQQSMPQNDGVHYLTLEETALVEALDKQIMDPSTPPERRRELIAIQNQIIRPVRSSMNFTSHGTMNPVKP